MKSLPKQWQNSDSVKQILYIILKVLIRAVKVCLLLNFSQCVKSYRHFSNFGSFTMSAQQIRSCHVAQDAILKIFHFVLILHLILGKVTKFLVEKLSTSKLST